MQGCRPRYVLAHSSCERAVVLSFDVYVLALRVSTSTYIQIMPGFPFKSRDIVNYSALLSNPWPYVLLARHNPPSRSLRWLSLTIVLGTQFNEGKKRKKTHIYHYQPSIGREPWRWRAQARSSHLKPASTRTRGTGAGGLARPDRLNDAVVITL